MKFIIVYITHKNQKEAEKVANALLKDHLIACVNYFPIQSAYWWKGKITKSKEVVTLVKTSRKNWKELQEKVADIHPYETPCIMKMEVEANDSYTRWIQDETK